MKTLETVVRVLGLGHRDLMGPVERVRQVRATSSIGLVVSLLFAGFNLLIGHGNATLGLLELAAALLLLLPAVWLSRRNQQVGLAEALVVAATLVLLGALLVFGGLKGTGLFWIYTAPFLAFFLKGQRRGWWYSLAFIGLVSAYFLLLQPLLPFAYPYETTVEAQFWFSLCFYTLVAAAFNQLRSSFEARLQQRVEEKTADARALLDQLQFLATHDALTALPNRVLLLEQLQADMAALPAQGGQLLVCNLRLERLFEMGHVLGPVGSDNLVRSVAAHLGALCAGGQARLARTRRDEFLIALPVADGELRPALVQQIIDERHFSVAEQGYTLFVEFTLGLALYPSHAQDAEQLLNKAEQAMLQARKNDLQCTVYDAQQEQVFVQHHLLFGKLREALRLQQLQVHYQPQIDLATGRVIGAEALARWHDPASGMVPPIAFIPVAEESGLIRPLTTWLIGQCLTDCARWQREGLTLGVSINLSARNLLDPELLDVLQAALQASGVSPQSVNMEITESCFMASPERSMAVIQRIHDAGFKLSIDDFGTGYSSLSYLKNLPIDELKIDQSFVRTLLDNPDDQAIVSSTIDLAHNFKLCVVAEGIEDEATAAWLQARGCDIGQGYCIARPLPLNDFLAFARAREEALTPPDRDTP